MSKSLYDKARITDPAWPVPFDPAPPSWSRDEVFTLEHLLQMLSGLEEFNEILAREMRDYLWGGGDGPAGAGTAE